MRGPWVEAVQCRECRDGWVPSYFSDDVSTAAEAARKRPDFRTVSICTTCGARDAWKARVIGRKTRPWWDVFAWTPATWEWREPKKEAAIPIILTGAMRGRLLKMAFTNEQIDSMKPAEAWTLLREVDPVWYEENVT